MVTSKKFNVLVSLSGGMDSTTVLHRCIKIGLSPFCVTFNYGSKHNKWELEAIEKLKVYYGNTIEHHTIDVSACMALTKSNLLKTGDDIPEGHYELASMKKTVVPGRNLMFISILASIAESLEIPEIHLGVHSGDHLIYPDCRPDFIRDTREAVRQSTENKVLIRAPYLYDDKKTILLIGYGELDLPKHANFGVPYHLTRTCYKDQKIACGKCGSCQERLEAFHLIKKEDPIEYESRILMPKNS